MKEVLKKYTSQKHERSTKKVYFFSASGKFLIYMLKVYFSEVLKSILLRSMKEALKKYTFLVLLASENFLSPNVLKVYFFHASSVLHFAGNFENFQSLKFVKSSKSMLKVYFSEVLTKYTSQKHERSTKKVYFFSASCIWKFSKSKCA